MQGSSTLVHYNKLSPEGGNYGVPPYQGGQGVVSYATQKGSVAHTSQPPTPMDDYLYRPPKPDFRALQTKQADTWQYTQPPVSALQPNVPLDQAFARPSLHGPFFDRPPQLDGQRANLDRPPLLDSPFHRLPNQQPPVDFRQHFEAQQLRLQRMRQQDLQQMQQQMTLERQVDRQTRQPDYAQRSPIQMPQPFRIPPQQAQSHPQQAQLQQHQPQHVHHDQQQQQAMQQQQQQAMQQQQQQAMQQQQQQAMQQQQQQAMQQQQQQAMQQQQQQQAMQMQQQQQAMQMQQQQQAMQMQQQQQQQAQEMQQQQAQLQEQFLQQSQQNSPQQISASVQHQLYPHGVSPVPAHCRIPPLALQGQGQAGHYVGGPVINRQAGSMFQQPSSQQQQSSERALFGEEESVKSQMTESAGAVCRTFGVTKEAGQHQMISAPAGTRPNLRMEANEQIVSKAFTPISVGESLPPAHIDLHGVCVNLRDFFDDRSGIIFGLVGAFYPVETKQIVPGILEAMDSFERLVDFVGCLVVNDPFVVKAWAKKLGVSDQFTFVADSDAKFTKALGMAVDLPEEGLGLRSRRFAAVVGPRARIRWIGFEEEALAPNVLVQLPKYVRTPWKSFLVGVGYQKKSKKAAEMAKEEKPAADALHAMRDALSVQGFCAESDWQLVLSDQLPDVYKPTRENILSGLKWLVEGSQAGDVLCFYFTGKGASHRDESGNTSFAILPMDHATNGLITEQELYELLAPLVPSSCRLTFIADLTTEERVTCPMPYLYDQPQAKTVINDPHWIAQGDSLPGEILTVTLEGPGNTKPGCLAKLLAPLVPVTGAEGSTSVPVVTYAEKVQQMNQQLKQMGLPGKRVLLGSSIPLDVTTEFSLADVLTSK